MDDHVIQIESLTEHGKFLSRLARQIAGDEHTADDVVQDTWRQLLEKPPHHGGALKAYLATVTRGIALTRKRGDQRRQARETATTPSRNAAPATDEVAERLELQKKIADCVLELREPYRTTVLLRFYDGLTRARSHCVWMSPSKRSRHGRRLRSAYCEIKSPVVVGPCSLPWQSFALGPKTIRRVRGSSGRSPRSLSRAICARGS